MDYKELKPSCVLPKDLPCTDEISTTRSHADKINRLIPKPKCILPPDSNAALVSTNNAYCKNTQNTQDPCGQ